MAKGRTYVYECQFRVLVDGVHYIFESLFYVPVSDKDIADRIVATIFSDYNHAIYDSRVDFLGAKCVGFID